MFKKTRPYLLLLVIVLSTVVGVFSSSEETVFAQGTDASVADGQLTDMTTISYNGDTYKLVRQSENEKYVEDTDQTHLFFVWVDPDNPTQHKVIWMTNKESQQRPGYETAFAVWGEFTCTDSGCEFQGDDVVDIEIALLDPADCASGAVVCGDFSNLGDGLAQLDIREPSNLCQIKGMGWLICPLVLLVAKVTDWAYNILENLLRLEPMALPGGSGNDAGLQLHNSWKIMRDFANIVFIIGFLFIVFSQVTSIGITNYGIKRLLPKLIIAAILVNISYYICVIAVDLSNILGNSMRGLLMGASVESQGGGPFSFTYYPEDPNAEPIEVHWWVDLVYLILGAGTAIATVATSAVLIAYAPIFLPMVLGAALAILTVVIAMVLRQALVVILVVVSPLAFVALLLPNTESYFQKWRSLFVAMLLVYPIVSIIFGASALASRILMATDDFPTQLVGAGVSIIPLFITPLVMKVSGGLLNRWVGLVNDPAKGPVDGLKNNVQKRADRWDAKRNLSSLKGKRTPFGGLYSGRYRRAAKQEAEDAGIQRELNRAKSMYEAKEIKEDAKFRGRVAGDANDQSALDRAEARAQFTLTNAQLEDVKAAHATIDHLDSKEIYEMLRQGEHSDEKTAALLERFVQIGGTEQVAEMTNKYARGGEQTIVTQSLAQALQKDGPGWLKPQDIDEISRGQIGKPTIDEQGNLGRVGDFYEKTEANLADGVMSQGKIVAESRDALNFANKVTADAAAAGRTKARDVYGASAQAALENPRLQESIRHNRPAIETAAAAAPPRPAPAPAATVPAPPPGYVAGSSGIVVPARHVAPTPPPTSTSTPPPGRGTRPGGV